MYKELGRNRGHLRIDVIQPRSGSGSNGAGKSVKPSPTTIGAFHLGKAADAGDRSEAQRTVDPLCVVVRVSHYDQLFDTSQPVLGTFAQQLAAEISVRSSCSRSGSSHGFT